MWCGEKIFTTLSALQDIFQDLWALGQQLTEPTTGKNATTQKTLIDSLGHNLHCILSVLNEFQKKKLLLILDLRQSIHFLIIIHKVLDFRYNEHEEKIHEFVVSFSYHQRIYLTKCSECEIEETCLNKLSVIFYIKVMICHT